MSTPSETPRSTPSHPASSTGAGQPLAWHPPTGHGFREFGLSMLAACVMMSPVIAMGTAMIYGEWHAKEVSRLAQTEASLAHEHLVALAPLPQLPVTEATHGRDLFATTCVACHGPAGTGIVGLGKNLVESDFVAAQSDDSLHTFLVTGRPDARPVPMPPKAGRDDLTDSDLRDLVVYLRGLQDPRRMPPLAPMPAVASAPTAAEAATALAAAGGDAEIAKYIANGAKLFASTCIACHGKDGVGIKGNGKPLATSEFVRSLDDDALLAFIKRGRDPSDPKNTTGIGMPPKGGNPAFSDDDLLDVISYLRSLQGAAHPAAAPK